MFDDRKSVGNPDRITYCGAVEDHQQHFPEEAPYTAEIPVCELVCENFSKICQN